MNFNDLLVVTDDDIDFESYDKLDNYNRIYWLKLWENNSTKSIVKKFPNLVVLNDSDFISNKDHYFIAKEVQRMTKEWHSLMVSTTQREELSIDGINIADIYLYDLEQVLTRLYFKLTAIDNFIKNHKIQTIVHLKYKNTDALNSIEKVFSHFDITKILKSKYFDINFKSVEISVALPPKYILNEYISIIKRNIKTIGLRQLLIKIKNKISKSKIRKKNSIIISNGDRCLHYFIKYAKRHYPISILDNSLYKKPISVDYKNYSSNQKYELLFLGFDLSELFKLLLNFAYSDNNNLKIFYSKILRLIEKHQPSIYITIDIASSVNYLKACAFMNSGVRTVLAPEGLGQPDENLRIVNDSVFRPELNIERWVVSKFSWDAYFDASDNIKITGYFDKSVLSNKSDILINKNHALVVMSGSQHRLFARAIQSESIFEVFRYLNDVLEVLTENKLSVTVKLHPSDEDMYELFKELCSKYKNVNIVLHGKINDIISQSSLVLLYESSVCLQALIMGKNVIHYDYTGRPSFISAYSNYLNKDLRSGNVIWTVKNRTQLDKKIKNIVNCQYESNVSSKLSYVLENASNKYDVKKVVGDLLIES